MTFTGIMVFPGGLSLPFKNYEDQASRQEDCTSEIVVHSPIEAITQEEFEKLQAYFSDYLENPIDEEIVVTDDKGALFFGGITGYTVGRFSRSLDKRGDDVVIEYYLRLVK